MDSKSLNIDWDNIPHPFAIDVYRNDKFSDVTLVSEDLGGVKAHRTSRVVAQP